MSGGSYNYLYSHDLATYRREVERMCATLDRLGHHDAAERLRGIVLAMTGIDEMCEIMRAVEWYESGDWGEDTLRNVVEEWRGRRPEAVEVELTFAGGVLVGAKQIL